MHYFIRRGAQEYGPYTAGDLERYVASGNISREDDAHATGDSALVKVGQLLAQAATASPFPPPGSATDTAGTGQAQLPIGQRFPQDGAAIPAGAYLPAYQRPQMANGAPLPPDFHWGLLLLLHFPTCGILTFVWMFMQAWWVRQIDRNSRAIWYMGGYLGVSYLIGTPISLGLQFLGESAFRESPALAFGLVGAVLLVSLGSLALFVAGAFSMRRSMLDYFNSTENIGLRLNGAMTFFFPIWYFQYHMSRIAKWKKTGFLMP